MDELKRLIREGWLILFIVAAMYIWLLFAPEDTRELRWMLSGHQSLWGR